jgi:drug efflux transport system permease protein
MSWGRLLALARKETIQIRRDPRSLAVVLLMPVMLMGLMGYGIGLDQSNIPLCVYDREASQTSQDLLKSFVSNRYFSLKLNARNYPELVDAVDSGRCTVGVVIPLYFSKLLGAGQTATVQAVIDATDNNTANLVIGYTQAVVARFSAKVQLDYQQRKGPALGAPTLKVEARTGFNEDLESRNFIVPGVVALVMAVIGTFLTSLTIAREWERGTMEQLISTPVTGTELIAGKLIPYFVIGMADAASCAAISAWWFEVPFRGSVLVLFGASAIFLTGVLLLGFLISALAKTQLAASQFALLTTFLPAFLLSGFAFPIDQMPAAVRVVTRIFPARYYVTILKSVFLKGTGVGPLLAPMLAMVLFAAVVGAATIRGFKKTLD